MNSPDDLGLISVPREVFTSGDLTVSKLNTRLEKSSPSFPFASKQKKGRESRVSKGGREREREW